MNERKIKMLEMALALFSEKGYHSTSIQEITEAWGISKGAFYNNFSSKEELMLSIMKHYTGLAFSQMQHVITGGSEKEDLIEQVRIQFSIIDSHKEYIRMHMTEQPMQMPKEIQRFAFETKVKTFKWYLKRLKEVYGRQIEPYALDCVVLFQAMIQGYMGLIILDQKPLQIEKTARFLVNRLDSIVKQLGEDKPLLTKELMKDFFSQTDETSRIQNCMIDLKNSHSSQFLDVLDTLMEEFSNAKPRKYIVEGLLLYLEKQGIEELSALREEVKLFFQSEE